MKNSHPQNPLAILRLKTTAVIVPALCIMSFCVFGKDAGARITLSNQLAINRPNEMIVVHWNEVSKVLPGITKEAIHVFEAKTHIEQSLQIVEEKGRPAEVLFMASLGPNETKEFIIESSAAKMPAAEPLTDARYMPPRQDVAWENDRSAHRIYGPALAKESNNGIDVWTKRVRYPIVEKWYRGDETPGAARISYHEDHGEGADFFDVGRSLGDGSCALIEGDSLYQPGVFESYNILATGPFRAMFEVTYKPVRFRNLDIRETKRITLDAGSNLNKIEVTYRCDSVQGDVPFAAGLVKRTGVKAYRNNDHCWVSLWGQTTEKEENGSLGTGIIVPKEPFDGIRENLIHLLVLGKAGLGKTIMYYAGAGWTRSGDFKNADEWNQYLTAYAQGIESPLKISLSAEK
jgi:pectinesterase